MRLREISQTDFVTVNLRRAGLLQMGRTASADRG